MIIRRHLRGRLCHVLQAVLLQVPGAPFGGVGGAARFAKGLLCRWGPRAVSLNVANPVIGRRNAGKGSERMRGVSSSRLASAPTSIDCLAAEQPTAKWASAAFVSAAAPPLGLQRETAQRFYYVVGQKSRGRQLLQAPWLQQPIQCSSPCSTGIHLLGRETAE